jgi:hypothetical protein
MDAIQAGQRVVATTSANKEIERRAASPVVDGSDFPVVWLCREEEWIAAAEQGRKPHTVPWPASAVHPA